MPPFYCSIRSSLHNIVSPYLFLFIIVHLEVQMYFTVMMNPCNDLILLKSILLSNLNDVITNATNGAYTVCASSLAPHHRPHLHTQPILTLTLALVLKFTLPLSLPRVKSC